MEGMTLSHSGHIENGKAVKYDFEITAILKEGWSKVKGFKATLWSGALIYILAIVILYSISYFISQIIIKGPSENFVSTFLSIIRTLILYPMSVGLFLLGVKRMADSPTRPAMIFDYYRSIVRIDSVLIISSLITFTLIFAGSFLSMVAIQSDFQLIIRFISLIGGLVLFLIGVYLLWGYLFAAILTAEKKLGIWSSLRISRKAVTQHWFKIFFLSILMMIILVISCIPLLIGLIWTLPWAYCTWGAVYRTIFGVDFVHERQASY